MRDPRRADLAKIHLARKQLGMDEETYRALLARAAGVDSAAKATAAGRGRILDEFRRLGWRPRPKGRPRPASDREQLCRKVRAMLMEAGRPDTYADSMAQRMFGIDRFEWLPADKLQKLVAALVYDQRRRKKRSTSS